MNASQFTNGIVIDWSIKIEQKKIENFIARSGLYKNKKKLTALWRVAYGFQKYWIYKNLLDGYLGHWTLLGDGPFNQLSDTKLISKSSGHKSITALFSGFSFYRITRKPTKFLHVGFL